MPKRVIRKAIKALAVTAGLVFLFVLPNTFAELALFAGSIVVLLVCLFLWHLLDLGEDDGFWPGKPHE